MVFKSKAQNIQDSEDIEISSTGDPFKDMVFNHLGKLLNLSNVEWRGGFYTSLETKNGSEKEIYVQDSREVFSNGVHALALFLQSKYDDDMDEKFKKFKDKLKILKDEFIEKSSVDEEVVLGEIYYTSSKDKILLETYKEKKLRLYLILFRELSILIDKKVFKNSNEGAVFR